MSIFNLFCEKCSLQFDKKYVFDLHLSLVHGEKIEVKNEPLVCEDNLKEPQMNKVVDKTFKCMECKICEAVFRQKGALKTHIASVHDSKKPFKCKICDSCFVTKQNLT